MQVKISQSLIKELFKENNCPNAIKYSYIERKEMRPTESMLKGQLFEYLLVGTLPRNGEVPVLEKGVKGQKLKAELDLEECVGYAKEVCRGIGLDIEGGEKQVRLTDKCGECSGYLDLLTNDVQNPSRKAIYDIKYTETAYDDRWRGWANFDFMEDAQLQARHYIYLAYETYGEWIPYYFLIFGKAGWVRLIKCVVTESSIFNTHMVAIIRAKEMIGQHESTGWAAAPEFNKCMGCSHYEYCDSKALIPQPEIHYI